MAAQEARVLVLWCPDWPVVAMMDQESLPADSPVAVLSKGEIFACSARARLDGVRRGMRRRDAASRCPELLFFDHSPEVDSAMFAEILKVVEEYSPGVAPIRPGLCALRVPSRYYGGEAEAAAVLAEQLVHFGLWDCRIGIADGIFAAEQAARRAPQQDCLVIEPGQSAAFLSPLSIGVLEDSEMVDLLRRMGLRRLGDFAQLKARDVLTRFGHTGAWAHRLAAGLDARPVVGRQPPPELEQQIEFAPPLERIEPIAFSVRQTAERFVGELARKGLVCLTVRIDIGGDGSWTGSRSWAHPRWFSAADLIDRVRWQLQAEPPPEPVSGVRLVPEVFNSVADHGDGLWGGAPTERIDRAVARIQSLLGYEAVVSPYLQGGRDPIDRQALVPWGERPTGLRSAGLPWPGSLPPPAPTRVFSVPVAATVLSAEGHSIAVTDRGLITADPARFSATGDRLQPVEAWAGPWPIDELWWDKAGARRVARFQLVGADGSAWLLMVENGQWWTEARYE